MKSELLDASTMIKRGYGGAVPYFYFYGCRKHIPTAEECETITCQPANLSELKLLFPLNNSEGISTNPVLSWQAYPGAVSFEVWVSTNNNFLTPIFSGNVGNVLSYQVLNLVVNTTYYWTVAAVLADGTKTFATPWEFLTANVLPSASYQWDVNFTRNAFAGWTTIPLPADYTHLMRSNDTSWYSDSRLSGATDISNIIIDNYLHLLSGSGGNLKKIIMPIFSLDITAVFTVGNLRVRVSANVITEGGVNLTTNLFDQTYTELSLPPNPLAISFPDEDVDYTFVDTEHLRIFVRVWVQRTAGTVALTGVDTTYTDWQLQDALGNNFLDGALINTGLCTWTLI